ncbi:MAG: DoxX family protein [Candidatus Acidiferrales bacterium]
MTEQSRKRAITALRWTVGFVVLFESCRFVLSHGPIHGGLPHWIRPVLGGAEVIAAILFLVPLTRAAGGYLLLIIFAAAVIIHILHGEYDVGPLLVYAMAVLATMNTQKGGVGAVGS